VIFNLFQDKGRFIYDKIKIKTKIKIKSSQKTFLSIKTNKLFSSQLYLTFFLYLVYLAIELIHWSFTSLKEMKLIFGLNF
jgi:hypothetical protein